MSFKCASAAKREKSYKFMETNESGINLKRGVVTISWGKFRKLIIAILNASRKNK